MVPALMWGYSHWKRGIHKLGVKAMALNVIFSLNYRVFYLSGPPQFDPMLCAIELALLFKYKNL